MPPYVSSHLKDMNRQNVYKLFCELGQSSKSEIARLTGISAPTVIKITNFMMEKGLVQEFGEGESALGRKPQLLRLNKNRYYSVGAVHEGDCLKVGITNLMNETVALKRVRVRDSFEQVVGEVLFSLINELLVENEIRLSDVLGIGLGIPGIYDVETQTVLTAPLIGITEQTNISPIIDKIRDRYHVDVIVENDLNMEVMGEFISLKLTEENDLIYLSLGTGIGSGVILNGSLRRGKHFMCGEVGYMAFLDDYIANTKNAGWLESKINLNALQEKFGLDPEGDNDPQDKKSAVEYIAISIALCINNMVMCYDCDHISIGGEIMDFFGDELFRAIVNKVRQLTVSDVQIHKKSCKEPGVLGAAGVVQQRAIKEILTE